MKRKICVVVTARASYARIKTALQAIRDHEQLELQLVIGASAVLNRYGDVLQCVKDDGFDVAAHVYMILEGGNLVTSAKSAGLGLVELATVLDNLKPDAVISIADRFETIATAIAAAYMNIPLVHIQGGEVTGSIDEKVRHAVTKLADLHLVATDDAAQRVTRLGENPDAIHVTGCPSIDLATSVTTRQGDASALLEKYGGVGADIDPGWGYAVVLQHPVTTEYEHARDFVNETLHAANDLAMPILWFWPNVDAGSDGTSNGIRAFRESHNPPQFRFFKHMEADDFIRLLRGAQCLIGNSSVGIRECAALGVPVVNIGQRQDGRQRGTNVTDVPNDRAAISSAARKQIEHGAFPPDPIYGDGQAGQRIANLLATVTLTTTKKITY